MLAVATPTDRLKSVRNRCVIKLFGAVCVLSRCFLDFSVGCRGFCHRTESDLFLFLSLPRFQDQGLTAQPNIHVHVPLRVCIREIKCIY